MRKRESGFLEQLYCVQSAMCDVTVPQATRFPIYQFIYNCSVLVSSFATSPTLFPPLYSPHSTPPLRSLPPPVAMAIPIETWYYEIPIVTRIYLTLAVLISLGVVSILLHPSFAYNPLLPPIVLKHCYALANRFHTPTTNVL